MWKSNYTCAVHFGHKLDKNPSSRACIVSHVRKNRRRVIAGKKIYD